MDDAFRQVLSDHFRRYPEMETIDFLKLIYQSIFGPRHLSENPTLADILAGIEEETSQIEKSGSETMDEDLGGDFVRISLHSVRSGSWTAQELADAFLKSFPLCPKMDKATLKRWNDRVNLFLTMNAEKIFARPEEELDAVLADLSRNGVRPLRHSETYRRLYQPHYRVIHAQFRK